jgi:predicted permease
MQDRKRERSASWAQRLIALIGVIVPRRFRTRWRREWEAELEYREQLLARWDRVGWRSKLALLWRSFGAFWDALLLQPRRLEDEMFQDLRYGARMLLKNKAFTAVAVFSLALGIGANTAIFSLMDAALLKMLPVKNPEQLVFLERVGITSNFKRTSELSYAFFEQLRAQREVLAGVCTIVGNPRVNVVVDGQAEVADVQMVSGGFYAVLGVNAILGRTIAEDDDQVPGGHPVAVISHHYWQRRFARDPAIVGKSIAVNGHPFTIIGVTPFDFFGVTVGEAPDLWVPTMMYAQLRPGGSIADYFKYPLWQVLARLNPGVTEQQASAVLTGLFQQSLAAASGSRQSSEEQQSLRRQGIALKPASQGLSSLRAQFSEPLRILMAVVGLILLIACANVANLLLARATARKKEIAVRLALGAGRLRLIRQLLTESMLLALAGGALGLLLAWWGSGFLLALVGSGHNPIFLKLTLDMRVLGFTAVASLLAGILFGLVPAWRATRVDLTPALKESARSSRGGGRLGLGKTLVIAQVALSLLLLIGAGLFVRSLEKLKSLDAGLNQENVLLVSTDPRMIGYQGRQIGELYQRMLGRIRAIPGVRSASHSRQGLLSGRGSMSGGSVYVLGQPVRQHENTFEGAPSNTTPVCEAGPEYFETVGMTILRGRGFTAQDNENAPRVAVVNETFARHYFAGADPLGQRFSFGPNGSGMEIIGIVKDAKYDNLREQALPTYYTSYLQFRPERETTFQIRTAADPTSIIAAVRQAVREVDANLPLYNIKTLATQIDESLVQERLIGTLSSFFGLLSLVLAAVGLYGIMAYAVSQRTHEIGIRMALGAQRGAVLRMVLRQGMKLVLLGVGLGLAASLVATRIIASQLFGITATDPATFVSAPLLLLMVALLACFVPARRATKVDPLVALRDE